MTQVEETLDLHYPQCLEADFGPQLPIAIDAVESIISAIADVDFAPLVRRSPGLKGNDFGNYLRCSVARMVHALAALSRRGIRRGRVLDYGAYFGNFALMLGKAGFTVDAVDSFRTYEGAFDRTGQLLRDAGVRSLDFADVGHDLNRLGAGSYDAVLCMGVIEHVPDSPRQLLGALDRVLVSGGHLIVDTPNLAHLYNRQKFARGESVMPELESFFFSEPPFEGHHREYTIPELVWLLRQTGHEAISVESFNYSLYGAGTLVGRDVYNHWVMVRDPLMRELLMTVSRKPASGGPSGAPRTSDDWNTLLEDPELAWQRALPAALLDMPSGMGVAEELMLERLQQEINKRDEDIKRIHDYLQGEIQLREDMMRKLEAHLQEEIQLRDRIIEDLRTNPPKRKWFS